MAQTLIIECPNVRKEADEGSFDMFSDGPMKEMVEMYGKNFADYGGLGSLNDSMCSSNSTTKVEYTMTSFAHHVHHEERGHVDVANTFRLGTFN